MLGLLLRDESFIKYASGAVGAFIIALICWGQANRPIATTAPVAPGHSYSVAVVKPSDDAGLLSGLALLFGVGGAVLTYRAADRAGDINDAFEYHRLRLDRELATQSIAYRQGRSLPQLQPQRQPHPEAPAPTGAETATPQRQTAVQVWDDGDALKRIVGSEIEPMVSAGAVMVLALQGAGKSTITRALIRERLRLGHQVVIGDHHAAFGEYEPLQVYGRCASDAECFADITQAIVNFIDEARKRETERRTMPESDWTFTDKPITLVTEELGRYKSEIDGGLFDAFMKCVCSDIRKANLFWVGTSQGDTLEYIGGASGYKDLIMRNAVIVRPNRKQNPNPVRADKSDRYIPDGTAALTIDGVESRVRVPDLRDESSADFTDVVAPVGTTASEFTNELKKRGFE